MKCRWVAVVAAAADLLGAALGNQRRNGFQCLVESVKQKFTLFNPEGIPLRATLSVTLREYKTLEEQLAHLNLTSPDRTHAHVTQRGETLSGIAGQYYRRPSQWRQIAAIGTHPGYARRRLLVASNSCNCQRPKLPGSHSL